MDGFAPYTENPFSFYFFLLQGFPFPIGKEFLGLENVYIDGEGKKAFIISELFFNHYDFTEYILIQLTQSDLNIYVNVEVKMC